MDPVPKILEKKRAKARRKDKSLYLWGMHVDDYPDLAGPNK